jgi:pyruvate kinase
MRRNRRAKIVATVGPASGSPEMLEALFLAGVDTFRLNFSHGTHVLGGSGGDPPFPGRRIARSHYGM